MKTPSSVAAQVRLLLALGFAIGLGIFLPASPTVAAPIVLVGQGATIRQYDAVTGSDLGIFASGFSFTGGIGYDDANQFVYAADFNANVVRKYTPNGTFLGNFGSGYTNPEGVAVDLAGNVYVSNYGANTVTLYNPAGTLLSTLSVGGPPEGLDFASNGDLLVNNYGGSVLRHTGGNFTTFASGLSNNLGIAVDPSGNVYVGEYTANRIRKYSSTGTPLGSVTLAYSPYGMDFHEATAELLVTNASPGNEINRYNSNLSFLGTLAVTASAPYHIAVIPEPSSGLLALLGLGGMLVRRSRRHSPLC